MTDLYTIYLLEPDDQCRMMYQRFLQRLLGDHELIAKNYSSPEEILKENPSLLLLDYHISEKDDFMRSESLFSFINNSFDDYSTSHNLIKEVKEQRPDLPIIAMTASSKPSPCQADYCLHKPFQPKQLEDILIEIGLVSASQLRK